MSFYTIQFSNGVDAFTLTTGTIQQYSTDLKFVGPNATNFSPAIAEDFLHLLENFSNSTSPSNPISGQLWYDSANSILKVNDGAGPTDWYPSGGVHKAAIAPTNVRVGDIWVDTAYEQLKIYNGTSWTLIGPSFAAAFQTGSYPDVVAGTDHADHFVIKDFLNGEVISLTAKEAFTPVLVIDGFTHVIPGVNLSSKIFDSTIPKFSGVVEAASGMRVTVPTVGTVPADHFVRTDIAQLMNGQLTINSNDGLKIGETVPSFTFKKVGINGIISNTADRSKIDFRISKDGSPVSTFTIEGQNNRVGINQFNPTASLDVVGTMKLSGAATLMGATSIGGALTVSTTSNFSGSMSVAGTSTFIGTATIANILPLAASTYDIGSSTIPFSTIWADTIGSTSTVFNGRSASTTRLAVGTSFGIIGQVATTSTTYFDGAGSTTTIFSTHLTVNSIIDQTLAGGAAATDMLTITDGTYLYKVSKSDFLGDITAQVVTGMIMAWGGTPLPLGWIECDGTSYSQTGIYTDLYAVIGTLYGSIGAGLFNVPNLPGLTTVSPVTTIRYIIKT